jgi:hypothetical protein
MKKEKYWPEIFVETEFLQRIDIINKIVRVNETTYNVNFEHPVLGQVVEIYEIQDDYLCLKSVYPYEAQEDVSKIDTAKDYYNNFLLDGIETYLDYHNAEIGYFLLSRNVKSVESPF